MHNVALFLFSFFLLGGISELIFNYPVLADDRDPFIVVLVLGIVLTFGLKKLLPKVTE